MELLEKYTVLKGLILDFLKKPDDSEIINYGKTSKKTKMGTRTSQWTK
jgi:hypothetical protein